MDRSGGAGQEGNVLFYLATPPEDFPNYAAGSDGPSAAAELLARDGRKWRPV